MNIPMDENRELKLITTK